MSDETVKEVLSGYVEEALGLRFGFELPPSTAAPTDVLDALLDVRSRLDRVELLLGRAIRLRASASRASAVATAVADDAWDQAVHRNRSAPVARGDEYSSAKERHAEANLTVLDERRTARRAAEMVSICDEHTDVIRLAHRGLADARQDVLAVLRAVQFESHLER